MLTRTEINTALDVFSKAQGRCWRACLSVYWCDGNYPEWADSQTLQQIRNQVGQGYVNRYTPKHLTRKGN